MSVSVCSPDAVNVHPVRRSRRSSSSHHSAIAPHENVLWPTSHCFLSHTQNSLLQGPASAEYRPINEALDSGVVRFWKRTYLARTTLSDNWTCYFNFSYTPGPSLHNAVATALIQTIQHPAFSFSHCTTLLIRLVAFSRTAVTRHCQFGDRVRL